MKCLRTIVQLAVIAAVVTVTVRHFLGASQSTIETWCPMGGLATLWSFFGDGLFTCVTGEVNVALFAALVLSAVLARKAFCGWVCPVGSLSEWARALSVNLFGRKEHPKALDTCFKEGAQGGEDCLSDQVGGRSNAHVGYIQPPPHEASTCQF